MGDSLGTMLESAAKALSYAATAVIVGVCATRWRLAPTLPQPYATTRLPALLLRLARLGSAAGGVAIGAALLRVWAHTAVAFGAEAAFEWENLRVIAIDSRWGGGWRLQVMAAALAMTAFRWATRRPARGWAAATAAAGLACFSVPLLGHAAGDIGRSAIHAAHVLGAGVWLGALAAVVLATRARGADSPLVRAALLSQLAGVALPGAGLLAVSGLWVAWLYVGSVEGLVASPYGRTLIVKLLLIGGVTACGFVNWRRYRDVAPRIAQASVPGEARLPSATVVVVELVLAAIVVAVTSLLTELEHPTG